MSNILAWATFNGTNGGIISACNIGSVTRLGTGVYQLKFTNPRNAADYGVIASVQRYPDQPPIACNSKDVTVEGFDLETTSDGQPIDPQIATVVVIAVNRV